MNALEVWGGLECTIARIGNIYRDQVRETGHDERPADLDLIAELGIRTLRYPVLWEAVAPGGIPSRGWDWHDQRLHRLRELGIQPVVGLLHHGSGPSDTNLLDPAFAERLALHASAVAERYPWIERYTPVNEPLTTARFSALYGHWYPHKKSYPDFFRALMNQCRATMLSMDAIRIINPAAQLIQTEDIGRVFSTPDLMAQAEHENERRWLSLDLLSGLVRPGHAFWSHLIEGGIDENELEQFWTSRPPDVIGVNHYLTSDRYLDGVLERYPAELHGGNGRDVYADVEAVRIAHLADQTGPLARIREVGKRYAAPLIISEVHHGSTRDEQLRWLSEIWTSAKAARQEGIDIRAVTVWSLFGAVDWNSVLTRQDGIYEPGVFDIRGGTPRPTALARATRELATVGRFYHPALATPAWWHRPERFYRDLPSVPAIIISHSPAIAVRSEPGPFLDQWLRIGDLRGLRMLHVSPSQQAEPKRQTSNFWGVIELGETETAEFCSWLKMAAGLRLSYTYLSSADVFDPARKAAAFEGDEPSAISLVGRRRAAQEAAVLIQHPQALVVRAASLFGPGTGVGLAEGNHHRRDGPDRNSGKFSYLPDLIHVTLDLMIDGERGIRHLSSGQPSASMDRDEAHFLELATERGSLMPPLESAIARSSLNQS